MYLTCWLCRTTQTFWGVCVTFTIFSVRISFLTMWNCEFQHLKLWLSIQESNHVSLTWINIFLDVIAHGCNFFRNFSLGALVLTRPKQRLFVFSCLFWRSACGPINRRDFRSYLLPTEPVDSRPDLWHLPLKLQWWRLAVFLQMNGLARSRLAVW